MLLNKLVQWEWHYFLSLPMSWKKVRSNSTALSENEFSGLLKQTKTARENSRLS